MICSRCTPRCISGRSVKDRSAHCRSDKLMVAVSRPEGREFLLEKIAPAVGLVTALSAVGVQPALAEYIPGPVEVGWEIYFGAAAGVFPFIIGAWEFTKRIVIQRRCAACKGSGLVQRGRFLRKCAKCGGFFPWQGWDQFFSATTSPGNGGRLRAPQGQDSVFYKVPTPLPSPPNETGVSKVTSSPSRVETSKEDSSKE